MRAILRCLDVDSVWQSTDGEELVVQNAALIDGTLSVVGVSGREWCGAPDAFAREFERVF